MRNIRRSFALAVFLLGSFMQPSAFAQGTMGTTLSDLWWNQNESGWGVTVDQQENVLFLTFFIQKADTSPYWVVAILNRTTPGTGITFPVSFFGNLYETHGTYYGFPWNPAQVSNRQAGTATFTATSINAATLNYSVDGVGVQKSVTRQPLKLISFQGAYLGGTIYQTFNCSPPSLNGQNIVDGGNLVISQNGTAISIFAQGSTATCTFIGTYSQAGQVGFTTGTYTCTDGTIGQFQLGTMQWTAFGMTAAIAGTNQLCSFAGAIGGITGNRLLP